MTTDIDALEQDGWYDASAATFGDRMLGAREAAGLSQQELSEQIGVKLKTIRQWEDDLGDPRANKLQTLAGLLNVSISWLLTGEGHGIPTPAEHGLRDIAGDLLDDVRAMRGYVTKLEARLAALEERLRHAAKE